jgi:hypothetical protein
MKPLAFWITLTILGMSAAGAAACRSIQPPTVPDSIKAPEGQIVLTKALAKGVQIYACKAKADDPQQFEWTLKAPEADLFDAAGKKVIKHYGGPTWEAQDGSKIAGTVKAKVDAPDASAIPWLLLTVKSHEGKGSLNDVAYIQRVNTVGGKAPAQGCDASKVGSEVRSPYQSDYYFYQAAQRY